MTTRTWTGETITEPGVYDNITLDEYHGKTDLLDGPSVSKSSLKWMLPAHGGSPKAFWHRWAGNPDRIKDKPSEALDLGRAVHCLLLGDEVFAERFAVRPERFADYRTKAAKEWRDNIRAEGKTVINPDYLETIRRIHADAAANELVRGGILNGAVERSMFAKDEATGIWIKTRPDVTPADGIWADLKTTSSMAEDFLTKQLFECGYYLQGAMTRMVCRALGLPFETFALVYVCTGETPDTAHVEIDAEDLDLGEKAVRWCLDTMAECLRSGDWPGARPFDDGTRNIKMNSWQKNALGRSIGLFEQEKAA